MKRFGIIGAVLALAPVLILFGQMQDIRRAGTVGGGGSTNVAWGAITGTLSSQTDLQSALNAKQSSIGFDGNTNHVVLGDSTVGPVPGGGGGGTVGAVVNVGPAPLAGVPFGSADGTLTNAVPLYATQPEYAVTGDQTLSYTNNNQSLIWSGSTNCNAFLPTGTTNGWIVVIKNTMASTFVVLTNTAGKTIDGQPSLNLPIGVFGIGCDGSNYRTLRIGPHGFPAGNLFYASPNGSNGVPFMRAIVAADIPSGAGGIVGTMINTTTPTQTNLAFVTSGLSGTNAIPGPSLNAFSPPASGLLMRLSADSLTGSDGDTLTNWSDLSGNTYNAITNGNPANPGPHLYNSVAGGHKSVRFFGNGEVTPENNLLILSSNLTVHASSLSYFFISRFVYEGNHSFISFGADGFTGNIQYREEGTTKSYFYPVLNGTLFTPPTKQRIPTGIVLHGIVMETNELQSTSTRIRQYINSMAVTGAPSQNTNQVYTGGNLGGNGVAGYELSGDLFEVLVYDHALSEGELSQLRTWAYSSYPIHPSPSDQVYCFGDSITGGGGSVPGNRVTKTWPALLEGNLGRSFNTYNFGYGGALITNIIGNLQGVTNLVVQQNRASSIITVQGGVNDLINGTNSWVAYTNFVFLAQTAKNAGAYVIGLTSPRAGTNAAAFNLRITSNLIADSGIDAIVDLQGDSRLANASNTNYWQVDGVHPNDNGCRVIAELIGQAIVGRTPNTETIPVGINTPVITASTSITLGGDTRTAWPTNNLPNTGTAGTYGDANHYPVVTTDAYGRVSTVTTQAVTSASVGTMVESSIAAAGVVPMTSDTTGTNYVASVITTSGTGNTNVVVGGALRANTLEIGTTAPTGGDVCSEVAGTGNTYMNFRTAAASKEAMSIYYDRTFTGFKAGMRVIETPARYCIWNPSAEMISVINGTNCVGIMTIKPTSTLHVAGSLARSIATGSAFTLTDTNEVYLVNVDAQTITLPTAVGHLGRFYTIKTITPAVTATIATTSSQTIDGQTTFQIGGQNDEVTVQSDNSNWNIMHVSVPDFVSSTIAIGSAITLTNATVSNITTISLSAGDWDVQGNVNFSAANATVTGTVGGITTTSATIPTDGTEVNSGVQVTVLSEKDSVTLPRKRVNVTTTTTVYLVAQSTFSAGTVTGYGSMTARRVR